VGERVYIRDYAAPRIDAPRPMLHARVLGFEHPISGEPMTFTVDPPPDFAQVLAVLRGQKA
jgi:23S rRNA-/tRNA-specific pseudouridylate synthase